MQTAPTWDALAVALNMPVREIYRTRKLPGAPIGKDVDEWREYFKSCNTLDLRGLPPTSYDGALATGKLEPDGALKHAKIVEQEIINEIKRAELARIRGDTLTKEEHRDRLKAFVDKVREAVITLPDLAADGVEPHKTSEVKRRAREWVDRILTKVSQSLNAI